MQFTKSLGYSLWGPEAGDKLLFLHGMGGTGALWRPIAASLEDHYAILAPDQRGHGRSQIAESVTYTPLDFGRDIVEMLSTLSFHPTWIVGHSMGVRSACATAFLKREWVKGLILVDLGFAGPAGGGLGDELADFLKILPSQFKDRARARSFMETHCPDPAIAQYLMAVSVTAPDRSLTFAFDHQALIQTIESVRDFSVRPWVLELAQDGMPILVLRGKNSLVWSREEFEIERENFKECPSVTFEEVEGTGHGLPFEKRLEFVARIREFIQ